MSQPGHHWQQTISIVKSPDIYLYTYIYYIHISLHFEQHHSPSLAAHYTTCEYHINPPINPNKSKNNHQLPKHQQHNFVFVFNGSCVHLYISSLLFLYSTLWHDMLLLSPVFADQTAREGRQVPFIVLLNRDHHLCTASRIMRTSIIIVLGERQIFVALIHLPDESIYHVDWMVLLRIRYLFKLHGSVSKNFLIWKQELKCPVLEPTTQDQPSLTAADD